MSTAPVDDVPDSLQPPAFVGQPSVTVVKPSRPFGLSVPWWDRLPAARRTLVGWAVVFALLLALPFVDTNGGDIDGFANSGTYVLLALGLNIVVGFTGLLDLGYAAFFALGAYTYGLAASFQLKIPWSALWIPFVWLGQVSQVRFGSGDVAQLHFSYWIMLPLAALICAGFGLLFGAPTLRLRGDYLAIVTLGFGEIIPDLATNNALGLTGGPNGLSGIDQPHITIGSLDINFGSNPSWFYWSLLIVVIAVVILLRNLQRARIGRAWMALREDEVAAAATGINTTSSKLLAFAIGASVSGLAGAFYGSIVTIVSPDDFSFSVSVAVLSVIVLGGIGNITGVILGSFVLTFVIFWALPHMNEWSTTVSQTIGAPALANIDFTKYTYMVYGAALMVMMLFRPGGLLPSRARKVELESGVESESLAAVQGRA